MILLKVEIASKEYLFLLDTGAGLSGIDISLRETLGKSRGSKLLQTAAGLTKAETYDWPDATLGGQVLRTDQKVACIDFTDLRQGTSESIFGVIGMDVLKNCRLQIDFDRGLVRFLETLPNIGDELGVRIPLERSEKGSPIIVGIVADNLTEPLVIDTGAQGNSLRAAIFDDLLGRELIRPGSSFTSRTIAGEVSGNRGRLFQLSVGPFKQENLRVARLNLSSLGLRYFSRFRVTFDFPENAVYLKKGENYLKPEPQATSGMTLNWIEGQITVNSVKANGPAAKAGLQSRDVLMKVNGKGVAEYDHFSLRQLLTSDGGKRVPVQILRDGREIDFELVLDHD